MKDTEKALKVELSQIFSGQGQRLTMMSKLIIAVLKMCTVNFAQLALVLNASVQTSSNFKRIQRFVRQYCFSEHRYIQWAWSQYGNKGQWIALSMDRTNWKFGRININILTIGISWRGTAIPLIWMMLDKRGQSNQAERILLLRRLLNCLNDKQKKRIRLLLMDREFAAYEWLTYLKKNNLFILSFESERMLKFVSPEGCRKRPPGSYSKAVTFGFCVSKGYFLVIAFLSPGSN